jgi:predicted TIM-barrel fold metal-dependent hydrolase
MNVAVRERETSKSQKLGIIDCDIHPMLKTPDQLHAYLPEKWRRYLDNTGHFLATPFSSALPYPKASPALSRRDSWPPAGGPPGCDLDFMREQHLDPQNIEFGMLQPLFPFANPQRNLGFARALCTGLNDWQMEQWTSKEPRLKASILVPQEDAAAAVKEIEQRAPLPDFAQVLLSPRSTEPMGRERYWPIYEAAAAADIPVAFHVGGVNGRPATGTGHCSYYFEEHHSHVQNMQALISSLILEGALEQFPQLRIVIIEAGMAWAPALGWRLDQTWMRLKDETPNVTRPPSEYLRQHFWFTTQPADEPEHPRYIRDMFDWVGWDHILFASDYPHWDYDDPRYAIPLQMSETERRLLFHDNARAVYRGL